MVARTHTRVHTEITFANPFLTCDNCKKSVDGYHDGNKCDCRDNFQLVPCGHNSNITSSCPSWNPVDGCNCNVRC